MQRTVEKVLHDFERFSSAHRLYLHLLDEKFLLPVVKHGRDWREVEWITPSYSQILGLVRNPTYAGIYVRGRKKSIVTLDGDGHKQTKRHRVPRDAWDVFLLDHHDAYITSQAWERNVEKIDSNANIRGPLTKGAAGRGSSIMAGLLRCRRCGHRLQAKYSSGGVRYVCSGGDRQRMRGAAQLPGLLRHAVGVAAGGRDSRGGQARGRGSGTTRHTAAGDATSRATSIAHRSCSGSRRSRAACRARIQANRCHVRGRAASVGGRMGDRAGSCGGGAVSPDRVR